MVNVMIVCIVPANELQRVKWEVVPAMVVHCLERRKREQEHGLTSRHTSNNLRSQCTARIKDKPFHGVIIQGPKRIRHVQSVMPRVKVLVQPLVNVHPPMKEVLPCIDYKPGTPQKCQC